MVHYLIQPAGLRREGWGMREDGGREGKVEEGGKSGLA